MDASTAPTRIIAERYEVLGILGQGGTGIVYDAVTPEGAAIALKVIHQELAGDAQIRGRFRREAEILRRLQGDHVCPIVDFGEVPGEAPGTTLLYIALPKIDGESLADVLAKGLIDVDRALDIMLEMLAALSSAHGQGIIHRDLKPANVLLASVGPDAREPARRERAIVVDFGMSKIVTGTGVGTTNLTTHNMLFGTPEYMAPEQARGDELDARCDVYAAGVILYEMLTGAPPFTGESPLNVLTAHLTSDLEPPSQRAIAQRVSPALDAVVVHALARDGSERYASAAELASAIRRARAAPHDAAGVRPAGPSPARPPFPSNAFVVDEDNVDPTAPTLLGAGAPRRIRSLPPPSAPPSAAMGAPPRELARGPLAPPAPRRSSGLSKRWVATWVLVAAASIAVGAWIALQR